MDTKWISVADVVERTGLTRQGVHHAVRQVLSQEDLTRKDDNDRWLIASTAVDHYVAYRSWPRAADVANAAEAAGVSEAEQRELIAELRQMAESAEMRASLAVAGEHDAIVSERDARIEHLERELQAMADAAERRDAELQALRAEYRASLAARLDSLQ